MAVTLRNIVSARLAAATGFVWYADVFTMTLLKQPAAQTEKPVVIPCLYCLIREIFGLLLQ